MLHIKTIEEGLDIFKALGSEVRISIIKLLTESGGMSMNELATLLNITNGALTNHIKKLEECHLITVVNETHGHGNIKKCVTQLDKILVEVNNKEDLKNIYETEIRVGQYSDYEIYPTCGLATAHHLVGEVDDSRFFGHSDRFNAEILWFTRGHIEYIIPNLLPRNQKIDQISLSVELGSEAPGINEIWPSDINFHLNGKWIGMWTSPGDFGEVKGIFTPDWWFPNWNQYGLLKLITINNKGTFVDGLKVSDMTIKHFDMDYQSPIKFRFSVPEDAEHVGGLTIYGKSFGNYNHDINVRIHYSPFAPKTESEA